MVFWGNKELENLKITIEGLVQDVTELKAKVAELEKPTK